MKKRETKLKIFNIKYSEKKHMAKMYLANKSIVNLQHASIISFKIFDIQLIMMSSTSLRLGTFCKRHKQSSCICASYYC